MAAPISTSTALAFRSCVLPLLFCFISGGCARRPAAPPLVRVEGDYFLLSDSGRAFTAWGQNYGHPEQLLEDFWVDHWPDVERDFREMKRLGVNVVRVHL